MPSLVEIGPVLLENKDFSNLSLYFRYFIIISPWKRAEPFIWTKLNSLHPRMHFAKFGWNWPSGSGEEIFFKFVNVFSLFRNYLPLEKGGALHLTKLNPLHPRMHFTKFEWNWPSGSGEEDFSNSSMYFHNFVIILLWKHLNKLKSPSLKDALCQV